SGLEPVPSRRHLPLRAALRLAKANRCGDAAGTDRPVHRPGTDVRQSARCARRDSLSLWTQRGCADARAAAPDRPGPTDAYGGRFAARPGTATSVVCGTAPATAGRWRWHIETCLLKWAREEPLCSKRECPRS